MTGFSRGQNVPLHRGLHQLGTSTNSNKMLYRLITVACTPPGEAELIGFRRLIVAFIPLQLTKSLSIVTSQSAFHLGRLLGALIIPEIKAAQARLYPGILCPRPIYTPGYIMA